MSNLELPGPTEHPPTELAETARPLLHDLANVLGSTSLRVSFVAAQVVEAEETGQTDWPQARTDLEAIAADLRAAAMITQTLQGAVTGPPDGQPDGQPDGLGDGATMTGDDTS